MGYVCHSGGCPGADMTWETAGEEYGVVTRAYSFSGHKQYGKNPVVLSHEELHEGLAHALDVNTQFKRNLMSSPRYTKCLISRNWYQVKNAEVIFAVGKFYDNTLTRVDGGTGWAVQMAVNNGKPIYFYDQPTESWYEYDHHNGKFVTFTGTPALRTKHFAGIGTRELTDAGMQAILDVYKKTFQNQDAD